MIYWTYYFFRNLPLFQHFYYISLEFVLFLLPTAAYLIFQEIYLFLSLNRNPCHLPYLTATLAFHATCHIILPLAMIRITSMYSPCSYIFHFTEFWSTLNFCNQTSSFDLQTICSILFTFSSYFWYLGKYIYSWHSPYFTIHPLLLLVTFSGSTINIVEQ